jgi:hypothetical protein
MLETLLRVKDKLDDNPTKALEVTRMHRGDTVVWMPEGHTWSDEEKTNPAWRIVRLNITVSEAEALVSPELDPTGLKANCWKRVRKFDLELIGPGAFRTFLEDDTRAEPIFEFTESITLIDAITVTKPNADTLVP